MKLLHTVIVPKPGLLYLYLYSTIVSAYNAKTVGYLLPSLQ